MRHTIRVVPEKLHWGFFDPKQEPILRIKSGDIIEVYTASETKAAVENVFAGKVPEELKGIEKKLKEKGPGPHVLTGPVYVEGATSNDALEVDLMEIDPWTPYGFNLIINGKGVIPEDFPQPRETAIPIDIKSRLASFSGLKIPSSYFFGILGVAPASKRITSSTVGNHGGNLDNKDLVAGAKLYLPIHVDGALFSVGDAHACQGDGEVNITALETCARGLIRLSVKKGHKLKWPMAETRENYILMGFAPTLDEALKLAVRNTISFLVGKGFDREEAYILCSMCVDFRVTQAVNDLRGIHAVLPKKIFQERVKSLL